MFPSCRKLWLELPEHGLIQGRISDVCGNRIPGPFPGARSCLRVHRWGPDHCQQWLSRSHLRGKDASKEQFFQVLRETHTAWICLLGLVSLPSHFCPALLLNLLIPSTPSSASAPSSLTSERWQEDGGGHSSLPTRNRAGSQGAQKAQPPNILSWFWKEMKPTGLGLVGGAGSALGFTRNSDWGWWAGSCLVKSYRKGNRKIQGGFYSSAGGSDKQGHLQHLLLWSEDHQDMIMQEMRQL